MIATIKRYLNRNGYLLIIATILFIISIVVDLIFPTRHSVKGIQKVIQNSITQKQNEFEKLCRDTGLLSSLIDKGYSESDLGTLISDNNFFFIYPESKKIEPSPVFWNTQHIIPPLNIIYGNDTVYFSRLQNGWYVIERKTLKIQDGSYIGIGLLPVKSDYYINNQYLRNNFFALAAAGETIDISLLTGEKIKSNNGAILFYLNPIDQNSAPYNNGVSIFLKLVAVLVILVFVNNISHTIVIAKGLWKGFSFFTCAIIFLRLITYFLPIPFYYKQFGIFKNGNLGDIFVNAALFAWIILFLRYHLKYSVINPRILRNRFGQLLIAASLIVTTGICANIIRSVVAEPQISFDVLNFFTLNYYSIVGFIVICCIALGYFFLVIIIFYISRSIIKSYYSLAIMVACISLVLSFFLTGYSLFNFFFFIIAWLLIFLALMFDKKLTSFTSQLMTSRLVFWLIFFSASITAIIVYENNVKELMSRKLFAQNIANKLDPAGERMISTAFKEFRNDFLADIFARLRNKEENKYLKDSLINETIAGYINKYDTKLYSFDAEGNILYNDDSTRYNTLNAIVETQAKKTSMPGVLYYDVSFDQFNYITKRQIVSKEGTILGYIFILSRPKSYKNDAIYPQLFTKGASTLLENSPLYAFAVYQNGKLINSYNDYPFPTRLKGDLQAQFTKKVKNGYSELWYKGDQGKIIIIAKSDNFVIEALTLFAYLFCGFLVVIIIINIIVFIIKNRVHIRHIKSLAALSIRNQIQGTIIFISILSFIIIGITTILFFVSRYNKNNRESLGKTISIMENELRGVLDSLSKNPDTYVFHSKLQESVNKFSELHATDMNLYDLRGNLQVSSIPLPYSKGILSTMMDPLAYYHLNVLKDVQYFKEQKIGDLKYLNNYVPIRNENGNEYLYLNIPYFESQNKLHEEISNFLVSIINLNAFIFIIATIIVFFINNRITRSFSFLSKKMREVNIEKTNEVINWKSKDEIGQLVDEYNKMVHKLEESAEKLARTEREGAWREMARQVAHEIKNPLTPMKLNLQYLQMAIDNNNPEIKEISAKVSRILVEQIDHLSKIASDFSQFANITLGGDEVFGLNRSLEQLIAFYSANQELQITSELSDKKTSIKGDKTHIHRLFTNLFENAIQSVSSGRIAMVNVKTSVQDNEVVVSVKDNGSGIPKQMQDKIFMPNFTTKTSGTGLGLAMCKGIVERMNGEIWFETQEGEGTTFFIKLPLAAT